MTTAFTLQTKIGLSVIMGLGVAASIFASFKTVQLRWIADAEDPTYSLGQVALWHYTELWSVLICGSIPPIHILFRVAYRKMGTILRLRSYPNQIS
ncbi:hypothetical protein BJX66DRAFT_312641 [Aspergillus keveii]|uniref:Rhodopsin domain-containing protein n=1 Tax=Aspergillus keveii TaxID=714993 RepID=A0ABR4FU45_9EURO